MYEVALSLLKKISQLGYEAYIVGGFPRDYYRGVKNTDIDICTSMSPDVIERNFVIVENHSSYGSFVIEKDNYQFEITTYRKDIYLEHRYPKVEFVSTLKEDLQRRDFVMNTLCIDQNGLYVDLLGAKGDIDEKIIHSVGNPEEKLKEDPLRIVRAIRFAADLDFCIETAFMECIKQYGYLLHQLSQSRIQKEINKVRNQKKWDYWVELLDLKSYLP